MERVQMSCAERRVARKRSGVIVLALGLSAGLLTACSGTSHEPHRADSVKAIPFEPIRPQAQPLVVNAADVGIVDCDPAKLSVLTQSGGGAGGAWIIPVTISNNGDQACGIDLAQLTFGFTNPDGGRHEFGAPLPGQAGVTTPVLDPSGAITIRAQLPETCAAAAAVDPASTLRTFVSVSGVDLTISGNEMPSAVASCASGISTGVLAQDNPYAADELVSPGDFAPLAISVDAPKAATAGGTLSYDVTLTNKGKHNVAFGDSCPTFIETVNIDGTISTETYKLNCASADHVAPGQADTFKMQVKLPAKRGQAKILWTINGGNSNGVLVESK
jgi:uncharacterized repeat protein (TIGR01451 family)